MKKIILLTGVIAVLFMASSCQQEGVKYALGDKAEVSFPLLL